MRASMFDRIKLMDPDNEDGVHHPRVRHGADGWRWECTCGAVSAKPRQGWRPSLLAAEYHCLTETPDVLRHMLKNSRRKLGC